MPLRLTEFDESGAKKGTVGAEKIAKNDAEWSRQLVACVAATRCSVQIRSSNPARAGRVSGRPSPKRTWKRKRTQATEWLARRCGADEPAILPEFGGAR